MGTLYVMTMFTWGISQGLKLVPAGLGSTRSVHVHVDVYAFT